jgi:uncharacterized integral membrane protein (TIGR00698 family)
MKRFFNLGIYRTLTIGKLIFVLLLVTILILKLSPGISLGIGLLFGLIVGNPYSNITQKLSKYLLQASVVGLGFAMDFHSVLEAGKDGMVYTTLTILGTLLLGYLLGKLFNINNVISYLISAGTAICGGSAIAAISSVIRANDQQISVSIGIIFLLNTIALFIFPAIGHYYGLSQNEFGIWSAIAIHDTSSVVGASSSYGHDSLVIATTVKLARALWIVPLVFVSALLFKNPSAKITFPYFIIFFFIASIIRTYVPVIEENSGNVLVLAQNGLAVTLFFIGSNISIASVKQIGVRPLLLGVLLWVIILVSSLWAVITFLD